jgi:uncharacterized protein (DUF488 family)
MTLPQNNETKLFVYLKTLFMPEKRIWTIGHSNHELEFFIQNLKSFEIRTLVDIRGLPGSAKFPWFNKENLITSLPNNGISYVHLAELGGRRRVRKDSKNTGWRLDSFRGYADYMETEEFKEAVKELCKIAERNATSIMCAEVLWWRCHRSLVSDYLKWSGWNVIHIIGPRKSQEHHFTTPAKILDGRLIYSA